MSGLGSKESSLFKTAIQLYEIKQYKKGLKTCEQILSKYPEHGETLALKGLFLLFLDKKQDGFDTCKRGLKLSLQSHISWHILGLMHRQDKNYEEAIKCYKSALKFDKDNFQILRDLALLQLQCRQIEGAIETRKKIIFSRPSSPFNWISLITVYHLSGNLEQALEVLDLYLELFGKIKDVAEHHRFYKVSILMELGKYEDAINYLQGSFRNKSSRRYIEAFTDASFNLKDFNSCENFIIKLIDINPDCKEYTDRLMSLYELQGKDSKECFGLIKSKSAFAAVELLHKIDFDLFAAEAPGILERVLSNGSPAAFQLFKGCIKDEKRRQIIWDAVNLLDQNLESIQTFKLKYLCETGNYNDALAALENSLNPENKDQVLLKAHILKKMGETNGICNDLDKIKEQVENDKFSISKISKYFIRYGSIKEAQELMGKFIQKPDLKDKMGDLHEMQAVWYLIEMADRLYSEGKAVHAACFYRKIELIFEEFVDDQLDFHGFSLRRMSFVEYISFLRFLDSDLKRDEVLKRAHIGMCKCLLQLSGQNDELNQIIGSVNAISIESQFADDLSPHLDFFRSIHQSSKLASDILTQICNNLLTNHSQDLNSLETALEVTLHLKQLLSAQKIAQSILELGGSISDETVATVNAHRIEDNSLWTNVPLLS